MGQQNSQPAKNAEATAERIISSACELFAEKGYDGAGVREIAARAGANVALINRYFGSKAGLFAAAVPPKLTIDPEMLGGDMAGALAQYMAHKPPGVAEDPLRALLLSIANP
ncbi:MAG: TetR family transcriptional regulator, partial [Pseudomonadota bacterium]